MKLNERRNQQCGCDKETKRDRKVLRKKKAAKAKHPRHHDNHLKLTRRVGFENFQRYQNGQKRYAGLNAFEGAVAEKDCTEHQAREDEFRSEEHTSELQSQSNLVCRLLLEKKKQHN